MHTTYIVCTGNSDGGVINLCWLELSWVELNCVSVTTLRDVYTLPFQLQLYARLCMIDVCSLFAVYAWSLIRLMSDASRGIEPAQRKSQCSFRSMSVTRQHFRRNSWKRFSDKIRKTNFRQSNKGTHGYVWLQGARAVKNFKIHFEESADTIAT